MRLRSKILDEVSVGYRPKPSLNKSTFILVFALLLTGASFYEGMVFQRNNDVSGNSPLASANVNSGQSYGGSTGGTGMQTGSFIHNHVIGQVAAVSSKSITIQDQNTGQNVTLGITSSTKVGVGGQSANTGDIRTGDLVIATKSSSTSSQASRIIVAPGSWNSAGGQPNTAAPLQGLSSN